jgi:hypothetical protein
MGQDAKRTNEAMRDAVAMIEAAGAADLDRWTEIWEGSDDISGVALCLSRLGWQFVEGHARRGGQTPEHVIAVLRDQANLRSD